MSNRNTITNILAQKVFLVSIIALGLFNYFTPAYSSDSSLPEINSSETKIITPESIDGSTIVTAEELIGLVDTIPGLIIIDSRIPGDRKQGYVEGSVSLPDINTSCESLRKVITKKTSPSLFYCNGVKCGRSAKAVKQ